MNARTKDFTSELNQYGSNSINNNNNNGEYASNNSSPINSNSNISHRDTSSSFLRYSFVDGFSSYSESSRSKKFEKLRSKKLVADLFMLAGHLEEAMKT